MPLIQLTDEQKKRVWELRASRSSRGGRGPLMGAKKIAVILGLSRMAVQRELGLDAQSGRARPSRATAQSGRVAPISIPAHVLMERDRRMALEHASITAYRCGDPLPGESVLDKLQSPWASERRK
jgi:hypothetical protein